MLKMDIHMWMTVEQIYWLAKPFREEPITTFWVEYEIKVAEHFFNSSPDKYSQMFLPIKREKTLMEGEKIRKELLKIRKNIIQEMKENNIDDIFLEVHFHTNLFAYPVY